LAADHVDQCRWRFSRHQDLHEIVGGTGRGTRFGASIINISSIMGMVGYSEASAYNAGKGAVRLFTKAVAIEFAQKRRLFA